MEMSPETIRALLDAFERSDWREMVVEVGEDRLHVSRDPIPVNGTGAGTTAAPAGPSAAPAGPVAAGDPPPLPVAKASSGVVPPTAPPTGGASDAKGTKVESPSVGLFWRAPSPGAPPFVELGARVQAGETVAIVEVMKLMNHVASPVDGVVTAILVENGEAVEFGQPIVVVDPEG